MPGNCRAIPRHAVRVPQLAPQSWRRTVYFLPHQEPTQRGACRRHNLSTTPTTQRELFTKWHAEFMSAVDARTAHASRHLKQPHTDANARQQMKHRSRQIPGDPSSSIDYQYISVVYRLAPEDSLSEILDHPCRYSHSIGNINITLNKARSDLARAEGQLKERDRTYLEQEHLNNLLQSHLIEATNLLQRILAHGQSCMPSQDILLRMPAPKPPAKVTALTVSRTLSQLRVERGMSQRQLADTLGIRQPSVSRQGRNTGRYCAFPRGLRQNHRLLGQRCSVLTECWPSPPSNLIPSSSWQRRTIPSKWTTSRHCRTGWPSSRAGISAPTVPTRLRRESCSASSSTCIANGRARRPGGICCGMPRRMT